MSASETVEKVARGAAVIRASEIGLYVFCHRAWWLRRVHGHRPQNRSALAAGVECHARHGRAVRAALRWQRMGYLLLGLGILAAIWAILKGLGAGV